jgi:hypothetical protein
MKLTKIRNTDGSEIWIQYDEEASDELHAVGLFEDIEDIVERTQRFKEAMASTVRGFSETVLNAVKTGMKELPPDKVTLQFGLQIGGQVGIPLVTTGAAQANVNVTVEWSLKEKETQD